MPQRASQLYPIMACGFICLVIVSALLWPLPIHLGQWHSPSAFGDSHIWVFEHSAHRLMAGDIAETTCAAGYPMPRHMRTIAWVPGLLAMLWMPIGGPIVSTQLLQMLSLPLSGVVAGILIRRWTQCSPWVAQGLGLVYALIPTHLAHLASGEISNTQAWLLPLWLLAMSQPRSTIHVGVASGLTAFVAGLTSPYTALALPLIGAFWVAGIALERPRTHILQRTQTKLVGWLCSGIALLPAYFYYVQDRAGGGESIFQPARRAIQSPGPLPHPSPVATLEDLAWSSGGVSGSPYEPVHGVYLGIGLLGFAIWSVRHLNAQEKRAGLALLAGGILLALGPAFTLNGQVIAISDQLIPLPVAALEAIGYPTQIGGLYYRYAIIAALGACILVAQRLSRHPLSMRWVGLLIAFQITDGIRGTHTEWPRQARPIAGYQALQALKGTDGAVLEIPIQGPTDAWFGQSALLRAVIHGRPTSALPRGIWDPRGSNHGLWEASMAAPHPESSRAILSEAGFRLVILPNELASHMQPDVKEIEARLGAPISTDGVTIWDLGPSPSAPVCAIKR